MPFAAVPVMLLSVLLAGCGTSVPPEEQARRMAGACQTRFCSCQQEDVGILTKIKKAPVQWRLNGDAYCQEGYTLRFDEPPKSSLAPW